MNNLANLPHAHSTYVHREKVLIFWLKNSIKLYCKESVTAGVLYTGNTCARVSVLINMTQAEVFSCEFCEIFKNTLSTEHPRVTGNFC